MPRYLDPKADIVFKKIFGQHPHLLKSFLNAVLPLSEGSFIESLEYLSSEHVPEIPGFKYTVVDVKCKDEQGRIFIVEMQIQWTDAFKQRLLFGASTAYVRQLKAGEDYHLLKPVYGLALLASVFDKESQDWYHHYKLVNIGKPEREIKHLQLVFIELPKFQPSSLQEKKLRALWLRFMSELNDDTDTIPPEWLTEPDIVEALHLSEQSAYSREELGAYESYWDAVSVEKTLRTGFYREGMEAGMQAGREQGTQEEKIRIARQLLSVKMEKSTISAITGLSLQELAAL